MMALVFVFGISVPSPVRAQSSASALSALCQTVESLISAGVINADMANTARSAANCPIPAVPKICSLIEMLISVGVIAPDKANAARSAIGCPMVPVPPIIVSTSTPSAVVSLVGSPTLDLVYSTIQKESQLAAKFKVNVTAGNSDVILRTDGATVGLFNNNDQQVNANSIRGSVNIYYGGIQNGIYTTISAGQTVTVTVTLTAKPSELFAGKYYAKLISLYTQDSADANGIFELRVPANKTNTQTIIGETSPYISSAVYGLMGESGLNLVVSGARLGSSVVMIDGTNLNTNPGNVFGYNDGTKLTLFVQLASSGLHTIQLINPITGASNIVGFTVIGSTNQSISVDNISTPTLELIYDTTQKESNLKATFSVRITAGSQDLTVLKPGNSTPFELPAITYFAFNMKGASTGYYGGSGTGYNTASLVKTSGSATENSNYFTIPAGGDAIFSVSNSFDVKKMFADSYSSSLLVGVQPSSPQGGNYDVTISAITNSQTIIGETSPYISSAAISETDGGVGSVKIGVNGVRLNNWTVYIDGTERNTGPAVGSIDGTSIAFTITSLSVGQHSLQIVVPNGATAGASNIVGFTVYPAPVTPPQPVTTLSTCKFDATKYANYYPDVKKAYGTNTGKLTNHWLKYGISEGRTPCGADMPACKFVGATYVNLYSDLVSAGVNGLDHYKMYGVNEGRDVCRMSVVSSESIPGYAAAFVGFESLMRLIQALR